MTYIGKLEVIRCKQNWRRKHTSTVLEDCFAKFFPGVDANDRYISTSVSLYSY